MGLLTLAEFRTDIQSALGDLSFDSARVDRWVNFGYLDLASSVDFEILDEDSTTPTVASTDNIAAPSNNLIIKLVKDITNDQMLEWVPKAEYFRRASTPTGTPTCWTRHKDEIKLNPVPSEVVSLFVVYKTPPTALSADGDLSVFADAWDPAIFLLAVHHALLALGREQRSITWLTRAITYIQTRITEADFHSSSPGLGASLPQGIEQLTRRLQYLQGAS